MQAQANSRRFRSVVLARRYAMRAFRSLLLNHSASVMGASRSLGLPRFAQHGRQQRLAGAGAPPVPQLEDLPPLARQVPLVVAQQPLDAGPVARPVAGHAAPQTLPQRRQALARHVTVVGPAQDLLHLLDARVQLLAER